MTFVEVLSHFEKDKTTDIVIIIGEIGGRAEEEAADFLEEYVKASCSFYCRDYSTTWKKDEACRSYYNRRCRGAREKIDALEKAGITVVRNPSEIGETVARVLAVRKATHRF